MADLTNDGLLIRITDQERQAIDAYKKLKSYGFHVYIDGCWNMDDEVQVVEFMRGLNPDGSKNGNWRDQE